MANYSDVSASKYFSLFAFVFISIRDKILLQRGREEQQYGKLLWRLSLEQFKTRVTLCPGARRCSRNGNLPNKPRHSQSIFFIQSPANANLWNLMQCMQRTEIPIIRRTKSFSSIFITTRNIIKENEAQSWGAAVDLTSIFDLFLDKSELILSVWNPILWPLFN